MTATTAWLTVAAVALVLALAMVGRGHWLLARVLRNNEPDIPVPTLVLVTAGWALLVLLVVAGLVVEIHRNTGYTP